jgi:hypothetical protein
MGPIFRASTCALFSAACGGAATASSDAATTNGGTSTGTPSAETRPCPDPVQFADPVVRAAVASSDTPLGERVLLELREPVASLSGVECLVGLKVVMLNSGGSLADLSPLAGLTQLDTLSVIGPLPALSDLSPLASLKSLTYLRISEAAVSDISALASLTNLTALFLSNNQIEDISSLASLTQLSAELQLDHNRISDLGSLAPLKGISALNLTSNSITDLTALAESFCVTPLPPSKPSFCSIDARQNPLDCASQAANIATLRSRGDIFTDCPTAAP